MGSERVLALAEGLKANGVDAYLATRTADIRWLTGFTGVFDQEQAHAVLVMPISADERTCLFTDTRYSESLRQLDTQGSWNVLDERKPRFAYVAEMIVRELGEVGKERPVVIGIESDLRLDWYKAFGKALDGICEEQGFTYELRAMSDATRGLRARKSRDEVALLKAAQAITDAGFAHMLDYLRPGLTEKEAAVELEFFMRRAGASGLAFPSIVASGPNSAVPHAVPGDRVMQSGDIVLMDFGARLDDYCSDMTRTVILGAASGQQKDMYDATLAAHMTVCLAYRPGMKCQMAQDIAEEVLAERGFAGKLIHSVGHGVGIDIHEYPFIGGQSLDVLEEGNVITVEPGVYLEGIGGVRIENCGVVTSDGYESFAESPRELIVV